MENHSELVEVARPDILEADDDDGGREAAAAAQPAEVEWRPSVFISHKCKVELDDQIASRLAEGLSGHCERVYLDLEQPIGGEIEAEIKTNIDTADYVIVLLTPEANNSQWVKAELSRAVNLYEQTGRPRIIPIRLGFTGPLDPRISAYVDRFRDISWNLGNYSELLDQVLSAIRVKTDLAGEAVHVGMENFRVGDSRMRLIRTAFIELPELGGATRLLRQKNLLWVTGDVGVRDYTALSLAVKEQSAAPREDGGQEKLRNVYEVPKSRSWAQINGTLVRDSVIFFRDANPAPRFDEESPRGELESLRALVQRNNIVVITTSEETFPDVMQELRRRDFEYDTHLRIGPDFYDDQTKLRIFEKLLEYSYDNGHINARQHDWARGLVTGPSPADPQDDSLEENRDAFHRLINRWSPADLERFATVHLRQVKRPRDIKRLLQRSAELDEEIHSWFLALDDSTRCFVLALLLFGDLNREQVWEKYKSVVGILKRLDPRLSLPPMGICRQRAALYVTTDGALGFVDERIREAVCQEIARSYREYFIELIPAMKQWSVPADRKPRAGESAEEVRKSQLEESKAVRAAIAQMIGKVGRHGLEGLSDVLDFWAKDPAYQVREASAIALEQMALDGEGAKHALGLLEKWCNDFSPRDQTLHRAWAAASSLGRIVSAKPGRFTYNKAFSQLVRLARDTRPSIRFYLSIPLKRMARKVPLPEIESLLSLVAQDGKPATRINLAEALNEARLLDRESAGAMRERWASSADESLRWVACCSQVIWRKQPWGERRRELEAFLRLDALTVGSVLLETIGHKYHGETVWPVFEQFVREAAAETTAALVDGLAGMPSHGYLEDKLLSRLRGSSDPRMEELAIALRYTLWKRLLPAPVLFLNELREELRQVQMKREVFKILSLLMRPEPEGSRRSLVGALAACYPTERQSLEEVLAALKDIAPSAFEPLTREVRGRAFVGLFYQPPAFVECASRDLNSAATADETRQVLETLARPEPDGYREELFQSLSHAYLLAPAAMRLLAGALRASGSHVLQQVAYEFSSRRLESAMAEPSRFLAEVSGAPDDASEREETLSVLSQMAAPGPQGRRRLLVQCLAEARRAQPAEVEVLLRSAVFQARPSLAGLNSEVKRAAMVSNFFAPSFVARFFAREP